MICSVYFGFLFEEMSSLSADLIELRDKLKNKTIGISDAEYKLTENGGFLLQDIQSFDKQSLAITFLTGHTLQWKPPHSFTRRYGLHRNSAIQLSF